MLRRKKSDRPVCLSPPPPTPLPSQKNLVRNDGWNYFQDEKVSEEKNIGNEKQFVRIKRKKCHTWTRMGRYWAIWSAILYNPIGLWSLTPLDLGLDHEPSSPSFWILNVISFSFSFCDDVSRVAPEVWDERWLRVSFHTRGPSLCEGERGDFWKASPTGARFRK